MNTSFITPNWPKPNNVQAYTITRHGSYQQVVPGALEPCWLKQVHGTKVIELNENITLPEADGSWTRMPNKICVVKTADCLPVLICDRKGTCVAALHAGWRGLAAGILEQGINKLPVKVNELLAWLGPAISAEFYEVGEEVRQAFLSTHIQSASAFKPSNRVGHWYMDLYSLARMRLEASGISAIFGGEYCTYRDADKFYSYRREKPVERIASLIWFDKHVRN